MFPIIFVVFYFSGLRCPNKNYVNNVKSYSSNIIYSNFSDANSYSVSIYSVNSNFTFKGFRIYLTIKWDKLSDLIQLWCKSLNSYDLLYKSRFNEITEANFINCLYNGIKFD